MAELKTILNGFYRSYDFRQRVKHDPIEFPHRYKTARDIEAAGFISCCLAYGKVDLFKSVIGKILVNMGSSPYNFLLDFSISRHAKRFRGIQYRFNRNQDIICLLFILHTLFRKAGSIEEVFMNYYHDEDLNIGNALTGMIDTFLTVNTAKVYGTDIKPSGLLQLFPSPASGSACKRQNLFLRWMVRDRDIDFGIWKNIPANRLVIPLDTHIMKLSQCLGFTQRKSADWKTAVEITGALKKLDSKDPLKYDFALCHQGISGLCRGVSNGSGCSKCAFLPYQK